ncbi:type VI secretion system-associated protein TagF [Ancylobacter amanitiformis]|uniref:Type VI secretion system protein ImpM n=1 Tax=Ancylobacter amanitiformis TaxID=217069 RepID=A0ABU0LL85_9HYPH|nr:type VI secretion system-associated protein TagF [Ancylobacter amanitiformis]MDQ0509454.1 type VI secretion system protein ImpM [Ancylobacter amanitiformis]
MSSPNRRGGGLFGKIPTTDDFIRRHLPLGFVTPWERWIASVIGGDGTLSREMWIQRYLTSPPWHFALDPGVAGPCGWVGVLISSVDSFGRAFPLTLAVPFSRSCGLLDLHEETHRLAGTLETMALDLIEGDMPVDVAAEYLATLHLAALPERHSVWRQVRGNVRQGNRLWILTGRRHRSVGCAASDLLTGVLREQANRPAGLTCWWHEGWGDFPPANVLVQGLPGVDTYMRMMDGAWTDDLPAQPLAREAPR